MKSKKLMAVLLSGIMVVSMLAGCGTDAGTQTTATTTDPSESVTETTETIETTEETPPTEAPSADPIERLTQGRFMYKFNVDVGFDMTNYYHFYEEQPIYGKIFYAGLCINQMNVAGTYEIEEKEFQYALWPDRDAMVAAEESGEEPPEGTAPYTITFYGFDGTVLGQAGYDGDVLYVPEMTSALAGTSSSDAMFYYEDANGENKEIYDGEVGQVLLDLVAVDEPTSQLKINHNGRYQDLVNMEVEGSWTVEEGTDGHTYTLTPDDPTDTGAVVTISPDGQAATYTPDEGDVVEMKDAKEAGPALTGSFSGEGPEVTEGTAAIISLYMYDDGSAKSTMSAFGTEMDLDQGTWEAVNQYTFSFKMSSAGEMVSELGEAGLPEIHYVHAGTQIGDMDVILTYVMEAE